MIEILASYPGVCEDCGGRIRVGDRIRRSAPGSVRRYVHVECPEARSVELRPSEVVCTSCFMVKPCPCDDGQAAS